MSQPSEEKPLTLSQLIHFYQKTVEPRLNKVEKDLRDFRIETLSRFDDLYKKFEDLRQEYIVANNRSLTAEQGKSFPFTHHANA